MKYLASTHLALIGGLLVGTTSTHAQAFDPNEGASEVRTPAMYRPLPAHVVPPRYYQAAPAAAPTPSAPVAAAVPAYHAVPYTPQTIARQPTLVAPTYPAPGATAGTIAPLPALTAPVYAAPVAAAEAPAPAPMPNVVRAPDHDAPPEYTASTSTSRFTLGIEGFYDEYQEDSVSLIDKGYFAGITASYEQSLGASMYGAIEFRAARGSTDYESISGTIDDISQWDMETRLLTGYDHQHGKTKIYAGLGSRYFSDELKGKVASLGGLGYDRRIFQLYVPIGITHRFAAWGLTFTPNIEYDHLIWGNVSSRLGTIPGFTNIENEQTEGYGLRGELMMGQVDTAGRGWQVGPFVRYWDTPDSEVDGGFIEPENTRLQAGVGAKVLF